MDPTGETPARRALVMASLGLTIAAGASCDEPEPPIPATCNGAEALCARRFDEVAYPTTHNAMSSAEDGWVEPNQHRGIARQLDDGVRALMLDVHRWEGDTYLCHAICELGSERLVDGLATIRRFLDDHRGEVVTIIFESDVAAADVAAAFEAADVTRLVHAQAAGEPWPTLREMIDADARLVVLTDDDGGGAYPWYMDVWAHGWETPFAARTVDDFTCDPGRGTPGSSLFIFNHFLTRTFAVPDDAAATNADPLLSDRLAACRAAAGGQLPNFVTVDFYDVGDLFAAVDALNGVSTR